MTTTQLYEQLTQQWQTLPERLGGHIGLTLAAMAIGTAISIPLGIWVARHRKAETMVLGLASVVQTIPSLALLAAMVFAFGQIGWTPAWIALVLYSVLPMLRSTVTGICGVDPAYIEAARGIGMSDWQMLRRVQLPLALPSIVAGIRTATVWVVGAATLAQPVGATSLGNYIFVGLQTSNVVAMVFGCVVSAALALTFDGLLRTVEIGINRRRHRLVWLAAGVLALVSATPMMIESSFNRTTKNAAVPSRQDSNADRVDQPPYVVGCKAFTEQYILSHIIRKRLASLNVPFEFRDGMGSAMVFNALANGDIDVFVDYTGTIWTNYMGRNDSSTPAEILVDVAAYLKQDKNIICLGPLGFSNDYVFAMKAERAAQLGIETLHDLAAKADTLSAATDIEFFDRPEWHQVRQVYGLKFAKQVTMDATLMYGAIANDEVDVIIAFSTDARIDKYDLRLIEDPEFAIPPYDAVLLVSRRTARDRRAMQALRPLVNSLPTPTMRRLNGMVDIERQSPEAAASEAITRFGIAP